MAFPGLGHVYLRSWRRALGWFLLGPVTVLWLVWSGVLPESLFQTGTSVQAILDAYEAMPLAAKATLFLTRVLSVVDAYLLARRAQLRERSDSVACPACGGELDAELDFCPWCTTRFADLEQAETPTQ